MTLEALRARLSDTELASPDQTRPRLTDWRKRLEGTCQFHLLPGTTEDVATICRYCRETHTPLQTQGGNTGLVGGSTPWKASSEGPEPILLTLERMNRLRVLDAQSQTMTAEAGMTLAEARAFAEAENFHFPLEFGSQDQATLGGLLSTNAGGIHVVRYGMARGLVWGVEAVLGTGEIYKERVVLPKNNAGYALTPLLVGSEGTLAILTAAHLKLYHRPRQAVLCLLGVSSLAHALELFCSWRALFEDFLSAFEVLSGPLARAAAQAGGLNLDLDPAPAWWLLAELTTNHPTLPLAELWQDELGRHDDKLLNAWFAQSERQEETFWRLRTLTPEAAGHFGKIVKNDIAVPLSRLPGFVETLESELSRLFPDCLSLPFGHLGDGSLHYSIACPNGAQLSPKAWEHQSSEIQALVQQTAVAHGGTISAEHGIGRFLVPALGRFHTPVTLACMRRLKALFDPDGILNPGVLF